VRDRVINLDGKVNAAALNAWRSMDRAAFERYVHDAGVEVLVISAPIRRSLFSAQPVGGFEHVGQVERLEVWVRDDRRACFRP
jgi:hypothetical protein